MTADHGEGLDEHGEAVHGFFVYETTLHVPLIVRGPGVTPGTQVRSLTRSVDVMPTVLDLLGLADATPAVSGRSLAPALAGKTHSGRADVRRVAHTADPLRLERPAGAARRPVEIHSGAPPRVVRPRSRPRRIEEPRRPGAAARARVSVRDSSSTFAQEQTAQRGTEPAAAAVPPDMLEKLGALGYVSPGGVSAERASGADPKDKIEEYKTLNTLMREGLVGSARKAIRRQPGAFPVAVRPRRRQLRVPLLRGPRADRTEAMARGRRPLRRRRSRSFPATRPRTSGSADACLADGKVDQALDAVRRGEKAAPDDPRLIEREGDIERRTRRRANRPRAPTSAWRRWPRATRSCASNWARCTATWDGSRTPPV